MVKIMYEGKEYHDKVIMTSKIKLPFKARFELLFHTHLKVEQIVYVESEMPKHKSYNVFTIYNPFDTIREWYHQLFPRKGLIYPNPDKNEKSKID